MRKMLRDLSIGRRLTVAFGLLCLLLVSVAAVGVYSQVRQTQLREDSSELSALRDDVKQLQYYDNDISGWLGYVYAEAVVDGAAAAVDPEADNNLAGLNQSRSEVEELLEQVDTAAMTPAEQARFDTIVQQWQDYFTAIDEMTAEIGADTDAGMRSAWELVNSGTLATVWEEMLGTTDELMTSVQKRTEALQSEAGDAADQAMLFMLVAAGLTLVLAVAMGIAVTRSIVRPVRRCVDAIDRVAEGDLTASPELDQRDEMGQLATAFDTTMSALRGIVSTMAESATTVATTAEEIAATSNTISASAVQASAEAQRASGAADDVSRNVQTVAAGSEQMGA